MMAYGTTFTASLTCREGLLGTSVQVLLVTIYFVYMHTVLRHQLDFISAHLMPLRAKLSSTPDMQQYLAGSMTMCGGMTGNSRWTPVTSRVHVTSPVVVSTVNLEASSGGLIFVLSRLAPRSILSYLHGSRKDVITLGYSRLWKLACVRKGDSLNSEGYKVSVGP